MKRKTVFSIFLGLFFLGCVLPLLAELLLRGGLLHPYAWLYQLLNRAGLPLIFCGLGGMLTLPVMGKASRRGRHFYRVVGIGFPLFYLITLVVPYLWVTATWIGDYPPLFVIPGVCLALTIPGKSNTAGKYVAKKEKKHGRDKTGKAGDASEKG